LELVNISVCYRTGLPLVLENVSFTLPRGKKLAVVGRSGCGKSTLMQVVLRLVEPVSGQVRIDDVDIRCVSGHNLRMRIAVIPQEAYLWRGSLRTNLDPLSIYSDSKLLEALEKCRIHENMTADDKASMLEYPVGDSGANYSVGERQLLCLCRAILRQSKVCFLDEATANIDSVSEARVQSVLMDVFTDSTVCVIAHRLQTVRNCDFALRLDHGKMIDFGPPHQVLGPDPGATDKPPPLRLFML